MLRRGLLLLLLAWCPAWWAGAADGAERRPNLVLIMTDNQGAWTLGCYGNPDIRTPNIDQLAATGMRFTRAFSSNPVCSPTRATYLTGLIPSQHGVHRYLGGNEAQMGPDAYCTIGEFRSLPKVLSEAGYVCGLVGKWHLGANLTPQEGFTYWITMPHGHTSTFYDAQVIENGKVRREPKYLTDLWTEHAVRFIEQNTDHPFFLFLSYNGPYGLGSSLTRPAQNRHFDYYEAKQDFPSFPRGEMHPWLNGNKAFLNNLTAIRRVAAEVSGVDDGVGTLLDCLKRNGLEEETLVVFCADQGWVGGQNGLWGMGDHTVPLTAFDGMMWIPLIFRHPGKIVEGGTCDLITSNYDFTPTVLSYLGLADRFQQVPQSPGRDYSPVLRGREIPDWNNTVFYEMENVRCIRTQAWKYVHRFPNGPHELYDLRHDRREMVNLYGQAGQAEIQRQLQKQLAGFFREYAEPKYDLYHGGGSKTALLSAGQPKSWPPVDE